jgi:PAS domain S-box-containing protein
MVTSPDDAPPSESSRVFVRFADDTDQRLVADWLAGLAEYDVVDDVEGSPPDACLLDGPALARHRETVTSFRAAADPVYVPVLLALDPDDDEEAALSEFTDGDATLVDDTVRMPVEKAVLDRRLEALLNVRRATVRLSERERQYRGLLRLLPEAVLLVRDGTVLYGNEAATALLGLDDPGDLTDRALSTLISADEGIGALLSTVAGGGRVEEFRRATMTTADGDTLETEVAAVQVRYDGDDATQLIVRDVTDRQRRRQQLNLYGRAVEAANQGITIADARREDEPLVYANPAFERITGYAIEEVLGRNCRFLQGANTDESSVARLREAIDAETPVSVDLLNYRKDGTPFWNKLDIVPVRDADDTVTHYLGLQRDVTVEKRREERLEVLDRVLRHNLRNRMTVIRGYAEELQRAGEPVADHILAAADDLLELTGGIRKFRDLVTSGDDRSEPRDVARMVREAADAARAEYPGATLRLECPETAVARAHGTLGLALGELFDLGMDAPNAELLVDVASDDRGVVVRVTDAGATMPEEELAVATKGIGGPLEHAQGLGVWFVRWAVDSSGGDLSLEEMPRGTAMVIHLLAPSEEQSGDAESPSGR